MSERELKAYLIHDSIRRLAKVASWHRRQTGRHADGHQRIANELTAEALAKVDLLRERASKGDEEANVCLKRVPMVGLQPPLDVAF